MKLHVLLFILFFIPGSFGFDNANKKSVTDDAKTITVETIGCEMIKIEGGTFLMGCFSRESGCQEDEHPAHFVDLDGFYLGKYEITVAQFRKFVRAANYKTEIDLEKWALIVADSGEWRTFKGLNWRNNAEGQLVNQGEDNHPVMHIRWLDAIKFCNWLSEEENIDKCYKISDNEVKFNPKADGYRLPTEAEWEYAARSGGQSNDFSWRNNDDAIIGGNVADETAKEEFNRWDIFQGYRDGYVFTAPVGSFAPNELGLYDMTGNVWEYCWDWYQYDYYHQKEKNNPLGPETGEYRVARGGSFYSSRHYCRTSARGVYSPNFIDDAFGFRIARNL